MAALGRRAVLLAAPLVAVLPGQASAGPVCPAPAPLAGALAAWGRPGPDGGALVRLVRMTGAGAVAETLGEWRVPPREPALPPLLHLGRSANRLALGVVAASWGVDPQSCLRSPGRIVDPSTGRGVDVRIWVDPGC